MQVKRILRYPVVTDHFKETLAEGNIKAWPVVQAVLHPEKLVQDDADDNVYTVYGGGYKIEGYLEKGYFTLVSAERA